jgi:hypothetical protein
VARTVASKVFGGLVEPPRFGREVGNDVGRGGEVGSEEVWIAWRVGDERGDGGGAGDVELHAVAVTMGVEFVVCCLWWRGGRWPWAGSGGSGRRRRRRPR